MKRALVLCGGGSKGAYEAGFIRALNELNIEIHGVFGTSIGALNGCLIASHQSHLLDNLWNEISLNTVIENDLSEDFKFDIDSIIDNKEILLSLLKSYIKDKGTDITPLKQLIRSLLDEQRLLSSEIDFGLCTVNYPSLKPLYIHKKDMEQEYIMDYLIASASCFPIFPVHTFNNQSYIDGGYYDNLPIDMAIEDGYDEIIAVDLRDEVTHKHYLNIPHIVYNIPRHDLGRFLDFNEAKIQRNKILGYNDCMKIYNVYHGIKYTFNKYENDLKDLFYKDILVFEKDLRNVVVKDMFVDFSKVLMDSKGGEFLSKYDYFYIVIDYFMEYLDKDPTIIYNIEEIINEIKKEFDINTKQRIKKVNKIISDIKSKGKKEYIRSIASDMLENNGKLEINMLESLFVKELMMARLIYNIYKQ